MAAPVRKEFHSVLQTLQTSGIAVQYSSLPSSTTPIEWQLLPAPVDPCRQQPPMPPERASRKRWQIEGMWHALAPMLDGFDIPVVVEFCGGCGNLGLPIASMLPHGRVIVADINPRSLEIAMERAETAGLTNVEVWLGDVRTFDLPFDVGVALHACGEATDISLQRCTHRAGGLCSVYGASGV